MKSSITIMLLLGMCMMMSFLTSKTTEKEVPVSKTAAEWEALSLEDKIVVINNLKDGEVMHYKLENGQEGDFPVNQEFKKRTIEMYITIAINPKAYGPTECMYTYCVLKGDGTCIGTSYCCTTSGAPGGFFCYPKGDCFYCN